MINVKRLVSNLIIILHIFYKYLYLIQSYDEFVLQERLMA